MNRPFASAEKWRAMFRAAGLTKQSIRLNVTRAGCMAAIGTWRGESAGRDANTRTLHCAGLSNPFSLSQFSTTAVYQNGNLGVLL